MLKIYTDKKIAQSSNLSVVLDVEAQYIVRYNDIIAKYENNQYALQILENIEGMTWHNGDVIKAKFGSVSMRDISTGGKACLLAVIYNEEFAVSNMEMGYNCICELFKVAKNININLIVDYVYEKLPIESEPEVYINDVRCENINEIIDMIELFKEGIA